MLLFKLFETVLLHVRLFILSERVRFGLVPAPRENLSQRDFKMENSLFRVNKSVMELYFYSLGEYICLLLIV